MKPEIRNALVGAMRSVDDVELALVTAVYRHLLRGTPAAVGELAADARWDPSDADERLRTWPAVFRDADDRVIGFWGLTSEPMPIRVRTEVGDASLWCALDPLFILPLVGTEGIVSAHCSVTSTPITIRVTPERVEALEPATPAMSLLLLEGGLQDNVQDVFCHSVLFFADHEAARTWTASQPGTFVVTLDEAAELGRAIAQRMRGS